jgi:hypothetical protein
MVCLRLCASLAVDCSTSWLIFKHITVRTGQQEQCWGMQHVAPSNQHQ